MMGALAAVPGRAADAVSIFRDMLREGVALDRVAMSTVLNVPAAASGTTASLHPFAVKLGLLHSSVVVCNNAARRLLQARPPRRWPEGVPGDAAQGRRHLQCHDDGVLQGRAAR
jgi:hypothetical protein